MSFTDRELQCVDCGATFTFSANEQEFFASKGFENDPKRCPDCRAAKKRDRRGDGFGSCRQMYPAVCANDSLLNARKPGGRSGNEMSGLPFVR